MFINDTFYKETDSLNKFIKLNHLNIKKVARKVATFFICKLHNISFF